MIQPKIFIMVIVIIVAIILIEIILGLYRNHRRSSTYNKALTKSKKIKKPLLVIGNPNAGFMNSIYPVYGCGDVCTDLVGCDGCKKSLKGDILDVLGKLKNNSHVVFESCLLEYVGDDKKKAKVVKEIKRVGGKNSYMVRISPALFVNWIYDLPLIKNGI
jgi:hypothetical protein